MLSWQLQWGTRRRGIRSRGIRSKAILLSRATRLRSILPSKAILLSRDILLSKAILSRVIRSRDVTIENQQRKEV